MKASIYCKRDIWRVRCGRRRWRFPTLEQALIKIARLIGGE